MADYLGANRITAPSASTTTIMTGMTSGRMANTRPPADERFSGMGVSVAQ